MNEPMSTLISLRCRWYEWSGAIKIGLTTLFALAGICWLLAGWIIISDSRQSDLNMLAIDSLRQEINLQRLTAQRDALFNVQTQLEKLGLHIVVADSTGNARMLRRQR